MSINTMWDGLTNPDAMVLDHDWDYAVSHGRVLRQLLFEHGTVPVWNFIFCGGGPELANPQSFAWTPFSLPLYLVHPVYFFLGLWLAMSALGFWALQRLLRDHGIGRLSAAVGAGIFVFSGYFISHFRVGHWGFAFFHLIPALMLAANKLMEFNPRQIASKRRWMFLLWLFSWILFTNGIPQTLFYPYLAFPVFVMAIAHKAATKKRLLVIITLHALGAVAAAYKLIPVMMWSQKYPRALEKTEHQSFADVLGALVIPYEEQLKAVSIANDRLFGVWEYSAFVGPTVIIFVLLGLLWLRNPKKPETAFLIRFALICGIIGAWLSTGNQSAWSLGFYFRQLPFASSIRSFGRYEVLVVLAIAILAAAGMSVLLEQLNAWLKVRRVKEKWPLRFTVLKILSVLILVAATFDQMLANNVVLLKRIRAVPRDDVAKIYGVDFSRTQMISARGIFSTDMDLLAEKRQWIDNCYEPLPNGLLRNFQGPEGILELSSPPPSAIEYGASSVTFRYLDSANNASVREIQFNMPLFAGYTYDPPATLKRPNGQLVFDVRQLKSGTITVHGPETVPWWSVLVSACGFLGAAVVIFGWPRRVRL